jgi:DNA replication regulator DPB11
VSQDSKTVRPSSSDPKTVSLWFAVTFRAQLQEAISANGGEYRGDLTKEVTHLIAYAPEGKKYQYATQWEIKVVGLRWVKDSLDRRMILDESLYHPTLPKDKQGAGAWNRQARADVQLGKRTRDEEPAPELPRKLRRTASAKLGSQSESLWGEIVSGPKAEQPEKIDQLRPSRSLPVMNARVLEVKSFATDTTGPDDDGRKLPTGQPTATNQHRSEKGMFSGFEFFLYAFTSKQVRHPDPCLRQCLC